MSPILGRSISSYVFVEGKEDTITQAEMKLRNTDITQPAMLAVNVSLLRVLGKFGFKPDMVIGHSLGEYAGERSSPNSGAGYGQRPAWRCGGRAGIDVDEQW